MEASTEQGTVRSWLRCYARSAEEATEVLEDSARGVLALTSLVEELRPPAIGDEDLH